MPAAQFHLYKSVKSVDKEPHYFSRATWFGPTVPTALCRS